MSYFGNKEASKGHHKFLVKPPEEAPFKNLKELEIGKEYIMSGGYINTKGKFGEQPVIWTEEFYVNLPEHMTEEVEEFLHNAEACNEIDLGQAGFKVYEYESKRYGTQRSVSFIEIK